MLDYYRQVSIVTFTLLRLNYQFFFNKSKEKVQVRLRVVRMRIGGKMSNCWSRSNATIRLSFANGFSNLRCEEKIGVKFNLHG